MILLAIPAFVARKGLESLFKEHCFQNKIHSLGHIDELNEFLKHHEPSLVYVHSSYANDIHPSYMQKEDFRLVRIIDQKPELLTDDSFQTDILYLDDDEAQIIKNIKRNIALTEKVNNALSGESELSEREKDVLREIALGKTNKEIADNLFISAHTAITHRKNITKKLGIKTVSGLTVYAILNKLIQMEEM